MFNRQWLGMMNAEDYGSCLTWPPPAFGVIPGQPVPANAVFPRTPVLVLSGVNSEGIGSGLRGGSFDFNSSDTGYVFDLDHVQWTRDLAVSGQIDWNQLSGEIVAKIRFDARGGHSGKLEITWNDRETEAIATLSGDVDGKRLSAERLAP